MSDPTPWGAGLIPAAEPAPRSAEQDLRARVSQQEGTGRLGLAALAGMSLPDLLEEAANVVAEVLPLEYGGVLELLPEGTALLLRAGVGWEEGLVGRATVGTNLQSQAGYALISSGPVVVEDLRTEHRFEGDHSCASTVW